MNAISKWALAFATVLVWALIANQSVQAQTLTTVYSFCSKSACKDGRNPFAGVIQGTDGNLYGTTQYGGTGTCNDGCGTVFQLSLSGTLVTLHSFARSTSGAWPTGGLAQATNGDFYGTAYVGGSGNGGTVFRVTSTGALKVLHSFSGTDGSTPWGTLILGTDGNLFGTTYTGGANNGGTGGTVFKVSPGGTLKTLYSSVSIYWNPFAGLVQGTNGDFYGTTQYGGTGTCNNGCGTIFKITTGGTLSTVYNFVGQEGSPPWPYAPLAQAATGDLYGMTEANGTNSSGSVFKVTTGGGGFKTLDSLSMNANPTSGLVQATDGNFYGTTNMDGANEAGTIFKVTPSGKLTVIYNFCSQSTEQQSCTDGGLPNAGLIQGTNGNLYGTTFYGGANNEGTVFSLSVGLGPFVETQINSGNVGATVTILGTDLTDATGVTFNGTAAIFTIVSASEITTTVPTGATTGLIEVTTSGGTLTSNKPFTVTD
jgi:uncharacterized repeat protein (TIGR03803 family)